jgi:hypothetical protein
MNISTRKGRWAAAIGALLVASSVAVVTASQTASAVSALPVTAVSRLSGDITGPGVLFNNGTSWPFSAGQTLDVTFPGVVKVDPLTGLPSTSLVQTTDGVLATWCANFNGATPLLSSDIGGLPGIVANCASIGDDPATAPVETAQFTVTVDDLTGNITVTGTIDGLPAGRTCQPAGGVIPCLLIVANTTQTVTLALPLVNVATVQVGGPLDPATLATTPALYANCTPTSAPPHSCPSTRQTTGAVPGTSLWMTALGGLGPASTTSIAAVLTGAATVGQVAHVITGSNLSLCTDLGVTCSAATLAGSVATPYPGLSVYGATNATGSVSAAFATAMPPGDYYMRVSYSSFVVSPVDPSAGFLGGCTALAGVADTWNCNSGAYFLAPIRVLGTPTLPTPTVLGTVGEVVTVTATGLDQWQTGIFKVLDVSGFQIGADIPVTSNGIGVATAQVPVTYPAAKVTFTSQLNTAAPVSLATGTLATDAGVGECVDVAGTAGACSAGQILSTTVDPGNLAMYIEAPEVIVPNPDLSTIDITDPDTWYVVSDGGPVGTILIGDMRGANTGFVITVQSSDLRGSATANNNVIPAGDVWFIEEAICEPYADAGDGNDPLGVVNGTTAADPLADPGNSLMSDGSQEACTLDPDISGLAGGMFTLDFAVAVAARPITPVDDYVGLLTITLTGN